jgi:hypothetical protein
MLDDRLPTYSVWGLALQAIGCCAVWRPSAVSRALQTVSPTLGQPIGFPTKYCPQKPTCCGWLHVGKQQP